MGLPEAGRGAHWETRIMRDDVMSYGFLPHVSSITLAAMEDLVRAPPTPTPSPHSSPFIPHGHPVPPWPC